MAIYTDPFDIYNKAARTRQRVTEQNSIRDQLAALSGGGARAYESLTRTYQQGMEPRTAGFAKRGLGNSGIFQRAMQEYAANQQRSLAMWHGHSRKVCRILMLKRLTRLMTIRIIWMLSL